MEENKRLTFKMFLERKGMVDQKIKQATKDKPMDQRKHHLKSSRGLDRKKSNYIPLYRQIAHNGELPTAQNVLKNAKESSSGVWKLSPKQVVELAGKYKFNPPDEKKSSKHLGSTGILMWRKNEKEFYLVKFSKHHNNPYKKKRKSRR